MDDTDYGNANPQKEGFPLELNSQLAQNDLKLIDTLFHELCHVRQVRDGVGNLSDLPMERYDVSIVGEAEARLMASLMVSHLNVKGGLSQNGNHWMEQALELDSLIYNSIKSGLMSQDKKLSDETADRRAKEEVLKSIVSGKNTPIVIAFVSEQNAQQFESANHKWLYSYSLGAGAQAYCDFYSIMHPDSPKSSELIDSIAQRLGVDRESLLSPTGVDLTNIQKDERGNILSAEQISRSTQENLGMVKSSYDNQNRVLHRTELNPDGSVKEDREYVYGNGEGVIPVKMIKTKPKTEACSAYTETVTYNPMGNRVSETHESESGINITLYKDGKRQKEFVETSYTVSEKIYDKNGHILSSIDVSKEDGTILNEFHEETTNQENVNLNIIRSGRGRSD